MEKAVITVVGKDKVGIMAGTCKYLADNKINILNITQSVMEDYFNMMMIVDMSRCDISIEEHCDRLDALGESIGVEIKLQPEKIFTQMHRI